MFQLLFLRKTTKETKEIYDFMYGKKLEILNVL